MHCGIVGMISSLKVKAFVYWQCLRSVTPLYQSSCRLGFRQCMRRSPQEFVFSPKEHPEDKPLCVWLVMFEVVVVADLSLTRECFIYVVVYNCTHDKLIIALSRLETGKHRPTLEAAQLCNSRQDGQMSQLLCFSQLQIGQIISITRLASWFAWQQSVELYAWSCNGTRLSFKSNRAADKRPGCKTQRIARTRWKS
ncbi:hypothetical protein PoB_006059400 [Plakobranchus ocellatus]|uniref:Uncharacterized protein n=1 Tax=Plakobranchus ocellatus TaxID=259542 RepID=A0AAV4CQE7_9GAST|nr:hypothetical protein PoB_006059400 [Plakobranchus ocellatus]